MKCTPENSKHLTYLKYLIEDSPVQLSLALLLQARLTGTSLNSLKSLSVSKSYSSIRPMTPSFAELATVTSSSLTEHISILTLFRPGRGGRGEDSARRNFGR